MQLCTVIDPVSIFSLRCFLSPTSVYLSFPLLSVNPGFPGQDPEETLDLDGAPALRLDSSMGVVTGVEEVDGRGCVCVLRGGGFMWKH